MPFRPSRTVRWAYDAASGALVEPPSGQQESGWDTGDRPAAQHFNYLFNVYGAWVDFLRSASLANWRAVTIPFDTDVIQLGHFAPTIDADTSTVETTSPVRRLVIAAEDGGGACVFISHRGDTWTRRNNFPSFTGYFRKVVYVPTSPTGRWFLLVDDASGGTLLYTNANSAVLANTGNWTAATLPGGTTGLRGLAYEATGGAHVLVSSDAIIASTNGTTWADATIASSPTGNFVDIAWTGTAFVAVTDDGETFIAGGGSSATGSWATATALPPGAGEWRLSVGAEGLLIAWRYNTGSTLSFYTSDDNATTWTEIVQSPSVERVNSLVFRDSTYVATTTEAPYLWQSNDLAKWTKLPGYYAQGDVGRTFAVTYSEGAWHAVRDSYTLQSSRAEDLSPSSWSPNTTATALADAAYLRGRELSETAPTNGQVYQWNSSTSKWTPATVSGASLPSAAGANEVPASTGAGTTYSAVTVPALLASVSNTRGRLLRRGASAWEALDASTADTLVGGDGTDVTTRTAAQVRASILGPFADPMTGSGWSTLPGSGTNTSTWSGGKLTMTLGSGGAASGGVSRSDFRPVALSGGAAIRVDVVTGDGGTQRQVYLALGKDASNGPALALYGDGTLHASVTDGGSYSLLGSSSTAASRTDGTLWIAIKFDGGVLAWMWGTGSGSALPTTWTIFHTTTTAATLSTCAGTFGQIGVVTDTGIAWEVDVLSVVTFLPGAV